MIRIRDYILTRPESILADSLGCLIDCSRGLWRWNLIVVQVDRAEGQIVLQAVSDVASPLHLGSNL